MPWKENTVESIRSDFIIEVEQNLESFSSLCRKYGITRKTGYKWYNRYKQGEGLSDKSKRPFNTPNKISDDLEEKITRMRNQYPYWGARKIKKVMENQGFKDLPSATTSTNVLKEIIKYKKKKVKKENTTLDTKKIFQMKCGKWILKGNF